MNGEISKLFERLAREESSLLLRRIRALIETPEARVQPSSGHAALASDLQPIYRLRHKRAVEKKNTKRFFGLSDLVAGLQASSPTRRIKIRTVVGDLEMANIFFDAETDELIGGVVITMSAHTRAFYRGELIGDPTIAAKGLKKPVTAGPRSTLKAKRVMA